MIFRCLNSVAAGDKEKILWLPLAQEYSKKEDCLEVRKMKATKEIYKSECHGECLSESCTGMRQSAQKLIRPWVASAGEMDLSLGV